MKKILIFIMAVMATLSTGFLVTNIKEYNENNEKITAKEGDNTYINEEAKTVEENIKNKHEEYEKLKKEKQEELEVYKKWQDKNKVMESYLQ